jgi:hypothetical protein
MTMKRALPWLLIVLVSGCDAGPGSRSLRGLALSPVELDLSGRDEEQVGLGSYLVNAVGACNDCHTAPSYFPGDPLQGQPPQINAMNYLAGGACFGAIRSPNITPDEQGLPAGRTLAEFIALIRTGHRPGDPTRVLQVMPWLVYAQMTDEDLTAIYAYLQAIPHAESLKTTCPTPPPPGR